MNNKHQSKKMFALKKKKKNTVSPHTQGTQGCVKTLCPVD